MKKRIIITVSLIAVLSLIFLTEVYGTGDEGFGIQLELDQDTISNLDRYQEYMDKRYDGPRKIVYGRKEIMKGNYMEGYFDVTCNHCGHENAQWITEDSVAYCSYCGHFGGMPAFLGTNLPEDYGSADENSSTDDIYYPTYEEEDDDDIPIAVVVGGGALIGAAVAKILKGGGKKTKSKAANLPKKEKKKEKEYEDDETAGFIINLSQDQIVLSKGLSGQVNIKVLRVNKDGTRALESSAPILIKQKHNSALKITPKNGFGELNIVIEEKANGNLKEETVNITTSIRGLEKSTKIEVRSENEMKVVFF